MKRIISGSIAVALALAIAVIAISAAFSKPKKLSAPSVPRIAQILGARVGLDTVESLEKRLGEGAPCMGGHPHGGRAWYIKSYRCWVYADGFEYDGKGGRIVDSIGLCSSKEDMYDFDYERPKPRIPQISVASSKSIGWLGAIVPGMTKRQVLKLTAGLPKPTAKGFTLVWSVRGTQRATDDVHPTEWTAELTFSRDKLSAIAVEGGRALWEMGR